MPAHLIDGQGPAHDDKDEAKRRLAKEKISKHVDDENVELDDLKGNQKG